MKFPASLKSDMNYTRRLFEAGLDAVQDGVANQPVGSELARAARDASVPAVVGAAVGVLCGWLTRKNNPGSGALLGGCVGGVLAFGAGLAWSSRTIAGPIARQAARNFAAVSDAHWLEKNPITYA